MFCYIAPLHLAYPKITQLHLEIFGFPHISLSGIFLPSWTWGQGPLILWKLVRKSTKLGKLDQKKKEQVIYILTRFILKFEQNMKN